MAYNYIETPRTDAGNATYLTNGLRSTTRHNLSILDSVEKSFQSPSEDRQLLNTTRSKRNRKSADFSLRTPRVGAAPRSSKSRRNLPASAIPKGEFTPLMKSVSKSNLLRNTGKGSLSTPAYLRDDYRDPNTPGLPKIDASELYEDGSLNSIEEEDPTPIPQVVNSSPQSTPLPLLSGRTGGRDVIANENVMTLREQEKVIDEIKKENFDLKLKVHFLQDRLSKLGPDLNRTAIDENIELKVTSKAMERDLHRCKKNLYQAERKAEACQRQLEEFQEKWKQNRADGTLKKELDWMKEELSSKKAEIEELHGELKGAQSKGSDELQGLRDQITDLEYELREKDRLLDQKGEEIEDLREKEHEKHGSLTDLESELARAKSQVRDLKESIEQLTSESQTATAACKRASDEKERAINDLNEIQEELANKSFHSKGLNRQLEEKANGLENQVTTLQHQLADCEAKLERKGESERELSQRVHDIQQQFLFEKNKLEDKVELAEHERDIARRELNSISSKLEDIEDELRARGDAKTVLQTRHDALTSESQGLQNDLERARNVISDLEQQISDEKQRSFETMEDARLRHRDELDQLHDDIESLQRKLEDNEAQYNVDRDKWESIKRTLELQKHQAEQHASGYKRTVEKLQQSETSLSSKEKKLHDIVEGEKRQHMQEKDLLNRQVKELNEDISSRRQLVESQRAELLSLKEELRLVKREKEAMKEKLQNLEDEAIVLKATLEQEQQMGNDKRKNNFSETEKQLKASIREKQSLREQLVQSETEVNDLRTAILEIKADRDDLKSQIDRNHNQADETYRLDQEKLDLRKSRLRLESELGRVKDEKEALVEAQTTLRNELETEIERAAAEENRLCAEIDQLQDKLFITTEKRDRELATSKGKAERLEKRVRDLEAVLEEHKTPEIEAAPATSDSSILRYHLDESRKKERAALQREVDLKSSVRQLKTRISDLETENHELQTQQLESAVPAGISPVSKFLEENRKLRSQVVEAHRKMKDMRTKTNELQRHVMMGEERKDLHELLQSATLEAENLSVKLAERDARVNELRNHLRRVRDERSLSRKQADASKEQLLMLQDKYEIALDDMMGHAEHKGRHEKELRGLGKEIIWLRARLLREEKFRKDLAWSKGIMELGERVRVACNKMDLRMIAEMGVEPGLAESSRLCSRRKLRSTAFAVMAAIRMQKMASEWKKAKLVGESLRKAKMALLKRREHAMKAAVPANG